MIKSKDKWSDYFKLIPFAILLCVIAPLGYQGYIAHWVDEACAAVNIDIYGTLPDIATSSYEQLQHNSTGTNALPRSLMLEYAMESVAKAGSDIGTPFTKRVLSTPENMGVLVDTALLAITWVMIDSIIEDSAVPVRMLEYLPLNELLPLTWGEDDVAAMDDENNATHWYRPPGSDSMMIAPMGMEVDSFNVIGFKRVKFSPDSLVDITLDEEYRRLAILWTMALASERLSNGKYEKYEARYDMAVKKIWARRMNPFYQEGQNGAP